MNSPRFKILDLAKEVSKMLDMQQDYYKANKAGMLDARQKLETCKKQERFIANVCATIIKDDEEVKQVGLFADPRPVERRIEGMVAADVVARYYGQEITCEYQTKDGVWMPTSGLVNSITIRHAELGRLRGMVEIPPAPFKKGGEIPPAPFVKGEQSTYAPTYAKASVGDSSVDKEKEVSNG